MKTSLMNIEHMGGEPQGLQQKPNGEEILGDKDVKSSYKN